MCARMQTEQQSALAKVRADGESARKGLAASEAREAQLEAELKASAAELARAKAQAALAIDQTHEELAASRAELTSRAVRVSSLEAEIESLQRSLEVSGAAAAEEVTTRLDALADEAARTEARLQAMLLEERAATRNACDDAEAAKTEAKTEAARLERELARAEQDGQEGLARQLAAEKEVAALRSATETLEQRLRTAEAAPPPPVPQESDGSILGSRVVEQVQRSRESPARVARTRACPDAPAWRAHARVHAAVAAVVGASGASLDTTHQGHHPNLVSLPASRLAAPLCAGGRRGQRGVAARRARAAQEEARDRQGGRWRRRHERWRRRGFVRREGRERGEAGRSSPICCPCPASWVQLDQQRQWRRWNRRWGSKRGWGRWAWRRWRCPCFWCGARGAQKGRGEPARAISGERVLKVCPSPREHPPCLDEHLPCPTAR